MSHVYIQPSIFDCICIYLCLYPYIYIKINLRKNNFLQVRPCTLVEPMAVESRPGKIRYPVLLRAIIFVDQTVFILDRFGYYVFQLDES